MYWQLYQQDSRLKALGIVDANTCPFSAEAWNNHALRNNNLEAMNANFIAFDDNPNAHVTAFTHKMFYGAQAGEQDLAWMVPELRKTPTPIAIAIFSEYLMGNYTGILPTITIPAIWFAGNSGLYKHGVEQGRYLASLIPNATFVPFDDAGHLPFYEQPEKFNAALADFIKQLG